MSGIYSERHTLEKTESPSETANEPVKKGDTAEVKESVAVNKMRTEFAALAVNEAFARAAAAAFFSRLDPTVEELTEIKTAVSEAVSNAVIHGYQGGSADKTVVMECEYENSGIIKIAVSDCGVGIKDVEEARRPLFTTGDAEERSGMGFTVMESFMDRVAVESEEGKGTRVTLIKSLDISYYGV